MQVPPLVNRELDPASITFGANEDRRDCNPSALWAIIAASLILHIGCLALASTLLETWRWENHPVHTATEIAGSLIALLVAGLLISIDRRHAGTSFNVWISAALIGMGLLDGMHALVYVGQPFVWLHTLATFAGGLLFNMVWLPKTWEERASRWWPPTVFSAALLLGVVGGALPQLTPPMLTVNEVGEKVFSDLAIWLNVGGGILLFFASVRLMMEFRRTRNLDDLLFCLHCVLFGAAATMFQQSHLWDIAWWGWHALRLLAYVVALWFIVLTVHREQERFHKLTGLMRRNNETLEKQVHTRTADLLKSHQKLHRSYWELKELASRERKSSAMIRAVMDSTVDGIITFDADGIIESANQAASEIFGYPEDEAIGKNLRMMVPNLDCFPCSELEGPRETVAIHRDGTEFPCEISVGELFLEGQQLYTGIFRDITARRRAATQRARMNRELIAASRKSGMADVASAVLHNVGNVLNSVGVTGNARARPIEKRENRQAEARCGNAKGAGRPTRRLPDQRPKGQALCRVSGSVRYCRYAT